MRHSAIITSSRENKDKKSLEKSYMFFILGSVILGVGVEYLIKERSDIILDITKNVIREFIYKNLKFYKFVPSDVVVDAVQKGVRISRATPAAFAGVVNRTTADLMGIPPTRITADIAQYIAVSNVAKSTWLGMIAWHFGKYTPATGMVTGLLIGFLCIRLINKYIDRRIQNLEKSVENLRKEINTLMLQKAKAEDYFLIEPLVDTPDEYICPITRMIINDPVIVADKHAYERSAITQWYTTSLKKTCPLNPDRILKNPQYLKTDSNLQANIKHYVELKGLNTDKKNGKFKILLDDSKKEMHKDNQCSWVSPAISFFPSNRNPFMLLGAGLSVIGVHLATHYCKTTTQGNLHI